MGCRELIRGIDISCEAGQGRYYQNMVLINRADVDQTRITSNDDRHRITFNLKPGARGNLFKGNDLARIFTANFSKSIERGVPQYTHNLQLPVSGIGEEEKSLLMQLDSADFFAVVPYTTGEFEVYGFEHGLTTENYTYDPAAATVIPISSRSAEYTPPFLYMAAGMEAIFYDNLFEGIGNIISGDFNNDFSDDFDNSKALI